MSEMGAYECLREIFEGKTSVDDIATLLGGLVDKGESVSEIVGFTRAMRDRMIGLELSGDAIDICGTGGSGKSRFNVSTSVGFVLNALGVGVAKHGNRGSKTANGSFDFLEALQVPFGQDKATLESIFKSTGLIFMFARYHHPAVANVGPARKVLGRRTIFNLIGPLCNPACVPYQIIGTLKRKVADKLAEAVRVLGTKRTLVIVGFDGLDELSNAGPSVVLDIRDSGVTEFLFDPAAEGIPVRSLDDISGGSAKENAALFCELISERRMDHAISQLVALNAGAALYCCGKTSTIIAGYHEALGAIGDGRVWAAYDAYLSAVS